MPSKTASGRSVSLDSQIIELVRLDGVCSSIDRETFRIGASEICELQLPGGPLLHSVIHNEGGVIWIEANDESIELLVNDRACHRMALRDGDMIKINDLEMMLRCRSDAPETNPEDISQMSAEELCDRILEEQGEVDAYEAGQLQGWQNLMLAMQAIHETPADIEQDEDCEKLLDQIRDMSDAINDQTLKLDDCEAELVAATALLHETHDRVSQQIESLLEQFGDLPLPGEMRASA